MPVPEQGHLLLEHAVVLEHAVDPPALEQQLGLVEGGPQLAYQLGSVGSGLVQLGKEPIQLGGQGARSGAGNRVSAGSGTAS